MYRTLTILVCLTIACGGDIVGPDASGDGPVDDGPSDAGASHDVTLPDGWDDANCVGATLVWTDGCNAAHDQYCALWARDRAYGDYGFSKCVLTLGGGTCSLGDYCPQPDACQCSATVICPANNSVCYSLTPDGSTHCKAACTPSP